MTFPLGNHPAAPYAARIHANSSAFVSARDVSLATWLRTRVRHQFCFCSRMRQASFHPSGTLTSATETYASSPSRRDELR